MNMKTRKMNNARRLLELGFKEISDGTGCFSRSLPLPRGMELRIVIRLGFADKNFAFVELKNENDGGIHICGEGTFPLLTEAPFEESMDSLLQRTRGAVKEWMLEIASKTDELMDLR